MKTILDCTKGKLDITEEKFSGCAVRKTQGEAFQRAMRNLSEVMSMFVILIVYTVSLMYTYIKTPQSYTLNACVLLYVNYTAVQLLKICNNFFHENLSKKNFLYLAFLQRTKHH